MADGGAMWAQMNAGPADPIRSFTAGASLAAQMDSIRQATQAASFNSTLQLLKLQEAKTDRADRLMLANRELELSAFNAETNRINALRPTRASSGYGGSGSLQNLIQLPDGSMGVDLGPADGSENVPQGTIPADDVNIPEGGAYDEMAPLGAVSDMPQQMPTSGEGDISGPPMSQRVPQGGGLTLPIQGGNNGSNPLLPSPSGAASGGEIVNINGRMVKRLPPNTSITQRGPGFSMTTRTPSEGKPKEIAPLDWDTMGKLAKFGGLELTGIDGFDANGRPQPKFEKPKVKDEKALYDFDQLDEETRAKITDSFKRVAFPVPPEGFTNAEKMAAVGIQLPPDATPEDEEAAGSKMTPELWTRGYNILREKAMANREQAVMEHAALLTSVAGKRVTPEEVIKMLPEYEPPADTRQGNVGTTMQKMTETGDTRTDGAPPAGLLKPGNLDPLNRKVLQNKDGTSSTASTISIGTDEGEVLIPTVVNGVRLSEKDAIEHYKKTKEHFGVFATPQDANTYAAQLHDKMEASVSRPKLSPEERRAIGTKAQAARVRFAHSGMKDTAADAEARALQKQLDDDGTAPAPSRAASAAAPAAAPGASPAASAQAPAGPIRSYAEMQTLRKEEEQKPLKEEDAKQWQSAKKEALDMIEKAAKKSGVPPQSILASIARGGPDKHSALSLAGVWDEFKGKDRYAFKRKASTPGMNQVTWEEVIESLADSGDLLQERYGITPEQLRAGGGQARRDLYK